MSAARRESAPAAHVFDSSALLAILFEEEGAAVAARALSGGIVSAVNASEVVAKLVDLGAGEAEAAASFRAFGLLVRPFDETLAVSIFIPAIFLVSTVWLVWWAWSRRIKPEDREDEYRPNR